MFYILKVKNPHKLFCIVEQLSSERSKVSCQVRPARSNLFHIEMFSYSDSETTFDGYCLMHILFSSCKKCDPTEVELDNQVITVTQSNICDEDNETCYAYDRNKCYTNRVPLLYGGKTIMVETALTPDSCFSD